MDYIFEIVQEVVVKVFHYSHGYTIEQESKHELIGEARFEVGRLMRAPSQKITLILAGPCAK
jgi:hypothetical protein